MVVTCVRVSVAVICVSMAVICLSVAVICVVVVVASGVAAAVCVIADRPSLRCNEFPNSRQPHPIGRATAG